MWLYLAMYGICTYTCIHTLFTSVLLYLVSPGYLITANASEYKFDVNVYSPVGTVVFEVLLIAENISNLNLLTSNFFGDQTLYGPYSINGMNEAITLNSPFTSNPLLAIALDESLDPNDNEVIYDFSIDIFAVFVTDLRNLRTNVILREIGKSLDS